MSFGWLGTFRSGSWQAFRKFVLEERKDVAARLQVIRAELSRIGDITVYYNSTIDEEGNTVKTEERLGFQVSPTSSLGKLIQAYIAQGGNPLDISMFLKPDSIATINPLDPDMSGTETQPHQGVNYPKSGDYSLLGGVYDGGYQSIKKFVAARTGGQRRLQDSTDAILVDQARRWVSQEIRYKRNDLEARIIKLCDLREQLQEEADRILSAVAGTLPEVPELDESKFTQDSLVPSIVAVIDSLFYVAEDGRADFSQENTEALGYHPNLLSDISPDEDNTAL